MSSVNKAFQSKSAQTYTGAGPTYFDLGVLEGSGFSFGFLHLVGTAGATWELRYNTTGVATGTDGTTVAWTGAEKFYTLANISQDLDFVNNNSTLALNVSGDGTQKVWLKLIAGASGTFIMSHSSSGGYARQP